jgi:hypothetical protein
MTKQPRDPKYNRNPTGKGGFQERPEDRWRGGRPANQDELKHLIHDIAGEVVTSKDGSISATRIAAILMNWATSNDVRKQELFVQYGWGKVKDSSTNLNVNLNELTDEQLIRIANGEDAAAVIAGRSTD